MFERPSVCNLLYYIFPACSFMVGVHLNHILNNVYFSMFSVCLSVEQLLPFKSWENENVTDGTVLSRHKYARCN